MRNIGVVFKFEFLSILGKKAFIITTIILALIVVGAIVIPTYFAKDNPAETNSGIIDSMGTNPSDVSQNQALAEAQIKALFQDSGYYLADSFSEQNGTKDVAVLPEDFAMFGYFRTKYDSRDALREDLDSKKIPFGVIFYSPVEFEILSNGQNLMNVYSFIEQSLAQNQRIRLLSDLGMTDTQIMDSYTKLFDTPIQGKLTNINARESGNYIVAMVYTFLVYMLILMFGNTVSTSVAREKDNRTMEILIANTKADYLIIGKTLAAGLAGIIQVFILLVAALVGLLISGIKFGEFSEMINFDLDPATIVIMIFFALTGYLLYLFIYAALGAMVSKMEDVSYAVTPITLLFVAGYAIAFLGLSVPDNIVFKVGSFIPFTSVLALPVRSMVVHVPVWQVLLSAVLMLVSIVLFSYLGIRIYRFGSLNYGNRLKFFPTLKLILRGEDK